jgi:hypothetical protein
MNENTKNQLDIELEMDCLNYHSDGTTSTEPASKEPNICAKRIKYILTGNIRFYIKRHGCEFYDPSAISFVYKKKPWKMGAVTEQQFNLYLQFLGFKDPASKGKIMYKSRAERLT